MRDCGSGTEQIWDVAALPNNRFKLRNRASQFCLASVTRAEEGGPVRQLDCAYQDEGWVAMFTKSSGTYLRVVNNGNFLSLRDGGTANGTVATVMEYAAISDEQWVLDPVSADAAQPQQIWVSPGKPITSYAGTAVTFQPECSSAEGMLSSDATTTSRPWHAQAANPIKNLTRADLTYNPNLDYYWQFCVYAHPTSSKMEVTLRNVAANAFGREGTNPSAGLIADQKTAANAERFILQLRSSRLNLGWGTEVLQSKKTGKYAVPDTAATGTLSRAIRFTSATPVVAAEVGTFW